MTGVHSPLVSLADDIAARKRKRRFLVGCILCILMIALIVGFVVGFHNRDDRDTRQMIWISDVHYSSPLHCSAEYRGQFPNTNCTAKFGCYGCDTTQPLLNATMEAIRSLPIPHLMSKESRTKFVESKSLTREEGRLGVVGGAYENLDVSAFIVSGDLAGHSPPSCEAHAAMINESAKYLLELSDAYGQAPLAVALGNDDCYPDYECPIGGSPTNLTCGSLAHLWTLWKPIVTRSNLVSEDTNMETFLRGGYYALRPTTDPRVLFLVMNTNPLSSSYDLPLVGGNQTDPAGQFQWLKEQLENASLNGDDVYIVGHIPPELAAFVVQDSGGVQTAAMWNVSFIPSFVSIVSNYSKTVKLMAFGHTHRNTFRLLTQSGQSVGADPVDPYNAHLYTVSSTQPDPDHSSLQSHTQTAKLRGSSSKTSAMSSSSGSNDAIVAHLLQEVAVSPIFFNNPGFRVLQYAARESARVLGYDQWYTSIPDANRFGIARFDMLYSFSDYCSSIGMLNTDYSCRPSLSFYEEFYNYLGQDSRSFFSFFTHRTQNYIPQPWTLYCAMQADSSSSADFQKCMENKAM